MVFVKVCNFKSSNVYSNVELLTELKPVF